MSEMNLLVGPPRCGNNWLRYIIESISIYQTGVVDQISKNVPTQKISQLNNARQNIAARRNPYWISQDTIPQKDYLKSPWFLHTHLSAKPSDIKPRRMWKKGECKFIGVLRNPVEAIARDHKHSKSGISTAIQAGIVNSYFLTLESIAEYKGPKIILYYEDLIDSKKIYDCLVSLSLFLNVDKEVIDKFYENLDFHTETSKSMYSQSWSDGTKDFWKRELGSWYQALEEQVWQHLDAVKQAGCPGPQLLERYE